MMSCYYSTVQQTRFIAQGGDILRLGRSPQVWRKVLAAYRWDDLKIAFGLTACTLGSALGPTLGNE